jgi:hypothetical protein
MIAKFNGTSSSSVKKSKFKMLQTWTIRNNYDYVCGQLRPKVLTMRGMNGQHCAHRRSTESTKI